MKKIISLIMALFIVFTTVIATNADELGELQDEQDRLEQQEQEYQDKVDSMQDDIDDKQEDIDEIVGQIETVNSEIITIRTSIEEYRTDIEAKEAEIEELKATAEENMNLFRERLCAIYKAGDVSSLEIILGASDFNDFVDKVQLVESMNEKDEKLIDDIESQMDTIGTEMETLNADKAELEAQETVLATKQEELNTLLSEHETELADLFSQQEEALNVLDSIEVSKTENEQKIQDYYDKLEEQNQQNNSNNNNTGSNGDGYEGGVSAPSGGKYVWPTPGHYTVTSEYSEDRGSYAHGGLDIAGNPFMGATVVAASSGTVVDCYNSCSHNWGKNGSCGCNGGWGNYVWIDHGNGKCSIYAHLSNHVVYSGQYVTAGQVIGYAGSTGYSTGPHLHFETRYYGTKYDPMTEF